jgi:sulfonate transport system ATP-binding protein
LRACGKRNGFTALLVTHDVQEAVALADRVILIEDGRIALDETHPRWPRPRAATVTPRLRLMEKRILDRVLQQPDAQAHTRSRTGLATPAHALALGHLTFTF